MGFFGVVVGGDTCATRKPDAVPILYACRELRLAPAKTLMVGDSINDVLAARAAGMPIVCVPYGYNEGADVGALPCDAFIDSLADLLPLLESAP
jgi:phosphoglycolate phosphatase